MLLYTTNIYCISICRHRNNNNFGYVSYRKKYVVCIGRQNEKHRERERVTEKEREQTDQKQYCDKIKPLIRCQKLILYHKFSLKVHQIALKEHKEVFFLSIQGQFQMC